MTENVQVDDISEYPYMRVRLSDLKPGMTVWVDRGFPCVDAGPVKVKSDEQGLYFDCDDGKHGFEFQENNYGTLSGIAIDGDPLLKGRDEYFTEGPDED